MNLQIQESNLIKYIGHMNVMAQQMNTLATKPEDPSLVARI